MSSSIWMQCAGNSEVRTLRLQPYRVVEAQHQVSTRKLVGSVEEQALLESLIDAAKPPDPSHGRLHYLLSTPFRYPPLRYGSRFGTRQERGLWYGSESLRSAMAEVAYYRLVFLAGTHADLGIVETQLTTFSVRIRTDRGIDLTAPPFDAHRDAIASPVSYAESQALGAGMRAAGIEVFRYPSARDPGGTNTGIFTWSVFGRSRPRDLRPWHCTASRERVELVERDYFGRTTLVFPRSSFLVAGRLPAPAP
jgi:hypothetical protein